MLGRMNSIIVDVNAAGHGWHIDETPLNDSGFTKPRSEIRDPHSIDLLTAVMHELGHVAGLPDLYDHESEDDFMYALQYFCFTCFR